MGRRVGKDSRDLKRVRKTVGIYGMERGQGKRVGKRVGKGAGRKECRKGG